MLQTARVQLAGAPGGPAGSLPALPGGGGGGGGGGSGGGGGVVRASVPDGGCGNQIGPGPGSYNWERYQPGSRFWEFQGIETGIFRSLAALLVFFAIRRLRQIA